MIRSCQVKIVLPYDPWVNVLTFSVVDTWTGIDGYPIEEYCQTACVENSPLGTISYDWQHH